MAAHSIVRTDKPFGLHLFLFFRWWYGRALGAVFSLALYMVAWVEDVFSLLVMFKAIITLQPMHQDYSLVGRAIGVVIRLLWVAIGLLGFALVLVCSLALVTAWSILPLVIITRLVLGLI